MTAIAILFDYFNVLTNSLCRWPPCLTVSHVRQPGRHCSLRMNPPSPPPSPPPSLQLDLLGFHSHQPPLIPTPHTALAAHLPQLLSLPLPRPCQRQCPKIR